MKNSYLLPLRTAAYPPTSVEEPSERQNDFLLLYSSFCSAESNLDCGENKATRYGVGGLAANEYAPLGTSGSEKWLWNLELGTVSPAHFIPVAEDTGLIVPIGKWVMKTACEQNVAWQRRGLRRIVMSVNLSPRQFKDPMLLDDIAEVLQRTGMAPELLELEITESLIMHNLDQAAEKAAAIKGLGVRLAIDDFGTATPRFHSSSVSRSIP